MPVEKAKGYIAKRRNAGNRQRKQVLLIASEGDNKTEKLYLCDFLSYNSDRISVRFTRGNETDPVKMIKRLMGEYDESDPQPDDQAFCLVDSDFDWHKNSQMKEADELIKQHKGRVKMIVSSPCFEVWFICHYVFSTRQYVNADDVLNTLRQHCPNYQKSGPNMYALLESIQQDAISNAKRLENNCLICGGQPHTVEFTPSTEMYKVIESIRPKQ